MENLIESKKQIKNLKKFISKLRVKQLLIVEKYPSNRTQNNKLLIHNDFVKMSKREIEILQNKITNLPNI